MIGWLKARLTRWTWELALWVHEKCYPNKLVLEDKELKCPECGCSDSLCVNESVFCHTHIKVGKNGGWDWDDTYGTHVYWETAEHRREQFEPEFHCNDCSIDFDAPNNFRTDVYNEEETNGLERVPAEDKDQEGQSLAYQA